MEQVWTPELTRISGGGGKILPKVPRQPSAAASFTQTNNSQKMWSKHRTLSRFCELLIYVDLRVAALYTGDIDKI